MQSRWRRKNGFAVIVLMVMGGCATYGDELAPAMALADEGEYREARAQLDQLLDPEGDERLLYRLEQGVLAHMAGDYEESIRLLMEADRIGEDLYTRYFRDAVRSALSNPRNRPYRGTRYELAYIHYFQALNFLVLAQQTDGRVERRRQLDSALVEVRRLDARLDELAFIEGDYESINGDDKGRRLSFLLRAFHGFSAGIRDRDRLQFREAAWLRYLSGVLYEMAGDLDDARIAYRRAAELYESGYAEQFALDEAMTEQAWRDTYRLARLTGLWPEWEAEARERLPEAAIEEILAIRPDQAQVVIVEHVGRMPPRGELNLFMYGDRFRNAITLRPVGVGTQQEQLYQEAWFRMMYADTGPLALMLHYHQGGLDGLIRGHFEKSFYLGGLWSDLASEGLLDPLRGGIRVTVPYAGPPPEPVSASRVSVNGERHRLLTADDLARMNHQDLLLHAGEELRRAAARELLRHTLAELAARELEERDDLTGYLLGAALRVGTSATARADTRAWQMLPAQVRLLRLHLPAGEHELRLGRGEWLEADGKRRLTLRLAPGEIRLLRARRSD